MTQTIKEPTHYYLIELQRFDADHESVALNLPSQDRRNDTVCGLGMTVAAYIDELCAGESHNTSHCEAVRGQFARFAQIMRNARDSMHNDKTKREKRDA